MANTLTNLIPSVYASLDVVSRELIGFIPSVTRSASADAVAINQTLYIPVAPANTTATITPAMSIPAIADQTIGTKALTITKQKASSFSWNGEEEFAMNKGPGVGNIVQDQIAQAFRVLANEMEADLWAMAYAGASRAYGTAGTTPFASDVSDTAQVRKILDDNGAPLSDRTVIIDTTAGAKLRTLAQITKANEAGSSMTLRDGELLNLHGMSIKESAQVTTVTAGTASGATTNAAGYAVGSTSFTLASAGTGTILAGDVITFAGDTNKYVVVTGDSDVSNGGTIVIQEPGIKVAMSAATKAITMVATSTRNVAFSRSALLLATRLPAVPAGGDLALDRQVVTDPRSGISFELALFPGYRMNKVEIAACWGTLAVAPRHCALLLG